MKNKIIGLFVLGIFVFGIGFSSALGSDSENMVIRANILKSEVGISVPETVVFPDLAQGYMSERVDVEVLNTGTVDVAITPELDGNYSGTIFQNIVFQKILTDPFTNIGYFDFEISKPTTVGDERSKNIYMYLNLEDYEEEISSDMLNHESEIIFTAMPI
jgi:hypothetical protein